jgi:DNA-binding NtrC family response regulator
MTSGSGNNHRPCILVVEDDAEMRALLVDELTDVGYKVCQAENGVEGVTKLAHEAFDLIITDMKMPQMSGMELLAVAKERCPAVPVIAVTAFGDEPEFVMAYRSEFFAYLHKPIKMEELKSAVLAALQRPQ